MASPLALTPSASESPRKRGGTLGDLGRLYNAASTYNCDRYGLGSFLVRLALWCATWSAKLVDSAVAPPARRGGYLLLRIFFAHLSDPRSDRAERNFVSGKLSSGCSSVAGRMATILVCPNAAVVVEWARGINRIVLGGNAGCAAPSVECLAPRNADYEPQAAVVAVILASSDDCDCVSES